jgi:FtsH-binding integral membrane protein
VFACFSGAALLSPRRQYLYLGGLLSSVLSTFLMMRLATFFLGGGALLFQAELFLGLIVFSGYVVYGERQRHSWLAAVVWTTETNLRAITLLICLLGAPGCRAIVSRPALHPTPCCVAADTQVIVERCEAGVADPLRDALDLFVDFAAIFVRLLVILLRNAQNKERQARERDGRRRSARTSRL